MDNNRKKKVRCRTQKQKIASLNKQLEHADYMSCEANSYKERVEWFQKKCELKSRLANASLFVRPVVQKEKQRYTGYIKGKDFEETFRRAASDAKQEEEFKKREDEKRKKY